MAQKKSKKDCIACEPTVVVQAAPAEPTNPAQEISELVRSGYTLRDAITKVKEKYDAR